MTDMYEIRLHGRGGQGIVMMGAAITRCFVIQGEYSHSMPSFGFERRGAPVETFVRASSQPIRLKSRIYNPSCIVVTDLTLRKAIEIFSGIKDNTILVINSPDPSRDLNLPDKITRVGVVDATAIALETLGVPIPNSCMLGAFAAATNWINIESIFEALTTDWTGELLEKNKRAAELGFHRCHILDRGKK